MKIWISKSHQSKYFKTYVTISADQIRHELHAEGLITDDMLTNIWCPTLKQKLSLDELTDEVYTKGGNKKDNVYMIRYYQL